MISDKIYFNINSLAKKTGLTRRTIRYYIQRGLLDAPLGAGRGHYYTESHLKRILLINAWRKQGVPIEKMKELIANKQVSYTQEPVIETRKKNEAIVSHISRWKMTKIQDVIELSYKEGFLSSDEEQRIAEFITNMLKNKKT